MGNLSSSSVSESDDDGNVDFEVKIAPVNSPQNIDKIKIIIIN